MDDYRKFLLVYLTWDEYDQCYWEVSVGYEFTPGDPLTFYVGPYTEMNSVIAHNLASWLNRMPLDLETYYDIAMDSILNHARP